MADHYNQRTENMNTTTIGAAIIVQTIIKYAAFLALAYLVLTFVDGWIMAWIGANHG